MKPALLAFTFLLFSLADRAWSQHHATGWIFTGRPCAGAGALVALVDATGSRIVTLLAGDSHSILAHDVVMDADNRSYVVTVQHWGRPSHLLGIDAVGVVTSTLATLMEPYGSGPGGRLLGLTANHDGDFHAILAPGTWGGEFGIVRVDRATRTVATLWTGAPFRDPVALLTDVETGDLFVLDRARYVFRVRANGSSVTTVAVLPLPVGYGLARNAATGDLFVPLQCPGHVVTGGPVLRVSVTGHVSTIPHPFFRSTDGICADRSSARLPRLVVTAGSANPGMTCTGILSFDPQNSATELIHTWPLYHYRTIRANRGRHLATRRIEPRAWEIRISFPGEAGRDYTLALSLSGTIPGRRLADRRHLPLNLDALSLLSVTGQLRPWLLGHAGSLDENGEARAVLDVRSLPVLAGRRIWVLAVSHQPRASFRIETIPDPLLIVL